MSSNVGFLEAGDFKPDYNKLASSNPLLESGSVMKKQNWLFLRNIQDVPVPFATS